MKLVYQYMEFFLTFPPASNHLHPLQVENCGSNSRLVVDEDDNGKFRIERVNIQIIRNTFFRFGFRIGFRIDFRTGLYRQNPNYSIL